MSLYICLYVYVLVYLRLIYVICFFIIIFNFITINHIISLTQKNLFFGHTCQKFNLRVLLSFCLIFCQFHPGVSYKSVAYKEKRVSNKEEIAKIVNGWIPLIIFEKNCILDFWLGSKYSSALDQSLEKETRKTFLGQLIEVDTGGVL